MASTVAMFTGLSGLNANARYLDVVGNNIANVNTTAYKSNRMLFASQFSRNLSLGSEPSDTNGGANPAQIGLGVTIAGTQRNFNTGSLSATGDNRDLAIEGDGMFIVTRGSNTYYTRAGAFRQDAANNLVTVTGERVQGYATDDNFEIVQGALTTLNIPVGQRRLAEATTTVSMTGNLRADGLLPSRGSLNDLGPLTDAVGGLPATAATVLTALNAPGQPLGTLQFTLGQFIELNGVDKGGKQLPARRLEVTAGRTVQDLMNFIRDGLGIRTDVGLNPDGATPGVTLTATGQIRVVGNTGTANDLTILPANIRHLDSDGVTEYTSPFAITKSAAADGESVRTTFVVYDSLGNQVEADLTMVLDSRTGGNGTGWRYYASSRDNLTGTLALPGGTGVVQFDARGQLALGTLPVAVTIDRTGSGADTPLSFSVNFRDERSQVTALADRRSDLANFFQDGIAVGTLTSYSVGQDGVITGAFSNGQTRTVGQVALAKFANPEGLVDIGNNLFGVGPASGNPLVTAPTSLGTGRIVGGSLELSNVDLAEEFINLIRASTGYSAASRVITTTDQLLQQLLVIGR